ncbi:MAG: neutral/alkaline non-lysosomal ceramidase N-terminal domain-containing protein [Nitrospirae bacterium]|nr:neutral/alkaline non-lysosomal ceramidase N-terminal domain-containing protein [Nitrospirota bacterium]
MNLRRTKELFSFLLALLGPQLIEGCLSLDYTPMDQQPFFHRTEQTLNALRVERTEAHPPGPLQVGAAKIEITPPIGLPMAGYGARTSTGVLDPIMARALAISDGRETVILVSLDLLAVTDDLFRSIFEKVHAVLPLPEENLLIAATHTHSGPGSLGKRFWETLAAGPFNAGVFEQTTDRAARAVIEAYRRLQPAVMAYGRADAGDRIQNRMIRDGPTDPDLSFLLFKTPEGRPLAYLVNFSAHPTLLRSTNRLLSGDFPAAVSRTLEKEDGRQETEQAGSAEAVALYTSGAVADQRARPPAGKDVYERTARMGRELAQRVLTAGAHLSFQNRATISSRSLWIELPPPQIKVNEARRLPGWIGRALLDDKTRVQVVQIDRTLLLAVPCDLGSEIGLVLKRRAAASGFEAVVIGFANDYIGYVIPGKYYSSPAYEAFMSFNGPHMEDYLTDILEKMIEGFNPPRNDTDR